MNASNDAADGFVIALSQNLWLWNSYFELNYGIIDELKKCIFTMEMEIEPLKSICHGKMEVF